MSVNAVHDPYQRRPRAIAHADVLAGTVGLDMAKAGWTATGDSYLGRVTKARILEAVREAKGEDAADRITGLKKAEMVTAAEDLLVRHRLAARPAAHATAAGRGRTGDRVARRGGPRRR